MGLEETYPIFRTKKRRKNEKYWIIYALIIKNIKNPLPYKNSTNLTTQKGQKDKQLFDYYEKIKMRTNCNLFKVKSAMKYFAKMSVYTRDFLNRHANYEISLKDKEQN